MLFFFSLLEPGFLLEPKEWEILGHFGKFGKIGHSRSKMHFT
jgi:hypothetical protein